MTPAVAAGQALPSGLQHGALPGRLLALEAGRSGVGETWLDPDDPIFAVHFPEWAVLPGSFVLRAAFATAAVVENARGWRLGSVTRVAFRQGARPSQSLRISVERIPGSDCTYTFAASADDARIADGEFTLIAAVPS